jgi:hypothetical protein
MPDDRLLVPVASPETAARLLDTAVDVAADRDLEVLVLTVVPDREEETVAEARGLLDRTAPALRTVERVEQTVSEGPSSRRSPATSRAPYSWPNGNRTFRTRCGGDYATGSSEAATPVRACRPQLAVRRLSAVEAPFTRFSKSRGR